MQRDTLVPCPLSTFLFLQAGIEGLFDTAPPRLDEIPEFRHLARAKGGRA